MEKVKARVLEFLSVCKLKGDTRGSILCMLGPPGIGKTSLGKSIATSLNRSFYRVSLGGVHTEAEVRGEGEAAEASCLSASFRYVSGGKSTSDSSGKAER